MAEEVSQGAVNPQEGSAESAPAESQSQITAPPAGEHPVGEQGTGSENRVPQSRFNEVIEQRNREREIRAQYEERIRQLEASRQSMPVESKSVIEAEAQALAEELGMDQKAALRILKAQEKVSSARESAVQAQLQQYQLGSWHSNLATKYPDYQALSPKMATEFDALSQHEQQQVLSSAKSLEMFYHYVKGQNMDSTIQDVKEKTAAGVYQNKLGKQAATSLPGASGAKPAQALSPKAIAEMSPEEYQKRLPEINAWLSRR